jgi:hypothetical protein
MVASDSPNVPLILFFALLGMLAIFGPPAWWYWHSKRLGERREKRWIPIIVGVLLMIGLRSGPKGDWLAWGINLLRACAGSWLVAWGVRGSRSAQF